MEKVILCHKCESKVAESYYEEHKKTCRHNSNDKKITFEEAISLQYPDKEIVKCPICKRSLRGFNMPPHLASAHGGNAVKRKSLSKLHRKALSQMKPTLREKPLKCTTLMTPESERIQRMGFDEGAKVPGSKIRKIDK